MRYIKTHEGFADLFKKKESIVKRYPLAEMREILAEIGDDFSINVDEHLSMTWFSKSIIDKTKYRKFGKTKDGKIFYFDWSNEKNANSYYLSLSKFGQMPYDGFESDDKKYNDLENLLKHKAEVYKFKYIIFTGISEIDNYYSAIIY